MNGHNKKSLLEQQLEERLLNEALSNEIFGKFLISCGLAPMEQEEFEMDGQIYTSTKVGSGKVYLDSGDYPTYYGGSFIDELGWLVVYIVGDLESAKKSFTKIVNRGDGFHLRPGRYSYRSLMEIKEKIDAAKELKEFKKIFDNVAAYGPDDRNNRFVVELFDLDEDFIKVFKELISDSEAISFETGGGVVDEVTVRPGQRITRANTNEGSTLTIRARTNGNPIGNQGFIMSGHATTAVGETIRFNGIPTVAIGTVRNRQNSGRVDSAYVQRTGTDIVLSQNLNQNSQVLTSTTSLAAVGTTVNLAGQASGVRSGQITHLNSTVSGFTGHRASYFSQGGDSGGPVYVRVSNQNWIVGVHKGSTLDANGNRTGALLGVIADTLSAFNIQLF